MLTHDLKEIEELLAQYYVPHDSHTLIIFKSAGELNRVIQLPVHATDRLTIDPDPYIVPLEMILEENERVLFLEIEKQEAGFRFTALDTARNKTGSSPLCPRIAWTIRFLVARSGIA